MKDIMSVDAARQKAVYFARLAEQAERYDEMAEHMKEVKLLSPGDLTEEERRLWAVAYNNAVGARKAAWRSISDAAREASMRGDGQHAELARAYCAKVGDELERICARTRDTLSSEQRTTDEAAVFYQKMKAETYRHAAELKRPSPQKKEAEAAAQKAYAKASEMAQSTLPSVHPLQFGLALSHSIFQAEVLGNPTEACRTAPLALRHLPSCGSLSPRGHAPPALVGQRLCDLLLEFPDAAIGGVRWKVLCNSYAELYGESLDLTRLGHETPSAAAHALLADVLRHQRCDSIRCIEDQEDPLVAVQDVVALTPLPRFAGSWPAVYKTLCALVRSCGVEDGEATSDTGPPGRILLLSQLRPLLDSAKDDDEGSVASQARSLLLSQLKPVSKLSKDCARENGLSFRDHEGVLRKLQKLGHVVKAVLQWRDQHTQWRRVKGGRPSAVDNALVPRLELVFSKRLNNLVLCLNDHVDGVAKSDNSEGADIPSDSRTDKFSLNKGQRPLEENPFKWQPASLPSDSRFVAGRRPSGFFVRSNSSPALSLNCAVACETSCSLGPTSIACDEVVPESAPKNDAEIASPVPELKAEILCPVRRFSPEPSSATHLFSRRSPSRGARSPSCPARADVGASGSEVRCTSEPPRQCWADMYDDPDDLVPLNMFERPSSTSPRTHYVDNLYAPADTLHRCTAADCVAEGQQLGVVRKRWTSPHLARSVAAHRSPSVETLSAKESATKRAMDDAHLASLEARRAAETARAEAESLQRQASEVATEFVALQRKQECARGRSLSRGRARSLARSPIGAMRRERSIRESRKPRCTSEPPQFRCINVFDDPFEPPPQETWCIPPASVAGVETFFREETEHGVSIANWPLATATGISRARAHTRSLSRPHAGEIQHSSPCSRDARCTSEPPQQRLANIFDDPFEPPPQVLR